MSRRHDIAYFDAAVPDIRAVIDESVRQDESGPHLSFLMRAVSEAVRASEADYHALFAALTRAVGEALGVTESPDIWTGLDAVTRAVQEAVGIDEPAGGAPWDLPAASPDGSFPVSLQDTVPTGLFFSPDGLNMYVAGNAGNTVEQYLLTDPYVITSGVSHVHSEPIGGRDDEIQDVFFSPDGENMYITGTQRDRLIQYSLGTAWDVSTAEFLRWISIRTWEAEPTGLFISPDGTRAYTVGTGSDSVTRFSLGTAWNVGTRNFVGSLPVSAQESQPQGVTFSPDGLRMFVTGSGSDAVHRYDLGTAWDISDAEYSGSMKDVSAQETAPLGVRFSPDGLRMFVVGSGSDAVQQYSFASGGGGVVTIDAVSALASEAVGVAEDEDIMQVLTAVLRIIDESAGMSDAGYYASEIARVVAEAVRADEIDRVIDTIERAVAEAVSVSESEHLAAAIAQAFDESVVAGESEHALPVSRLVLAESLDAAESGHVAGAVSQAYDEAVRMGESEYVASAISQILSEMARVSETEHADSVIVSVLRIIGEGLAVSETAYSETPVFAAVAEAVGASETEYRAASAFAEIAEAVGFSERGDAGWDIGDPEFVTSESVTNQERTPTSVFFRPTGRQMFVIGTSSDRFNFYDLETAWDINSAEFDNFVSLATRESSPRDMFIRPDGLRVYITGTNSDAVLEYSLNVAWNFATMGYSREFDLSGQDDVPVGLFFRQDGLKMYVTGNGTDTVYEYDLETAWDVTSAEYSGSFYDISAQDANPRGLFFRPDGLRMYHAGVGGDAIYQYSLGTAWDVSTAQYMDDMYMVTQDGIPTGMYIRSDGLKMYVTGNENDSVYEYDLPGTSGIVTLEILIRMIAEALEASESEDVMEIVSAIMRVLGEGISVSESDPFSIETFAEIAESVLSGESEYRLDALLREIAEGLALSEADVASVPIGLAISEAVRADETERLLPIIERSVTESAEISDALGMSSLAAISEAVVASEISGIAGEIHGIMSEALDAAESERVSMLNSLAFAEDMLAGDGAISVPAALVMLDEQALLSPTFHLTIPFSISHSEALDASDASDMLDVLTRAYGETAFFGESEYLSATAFGIVSERLVADETAHVLGTFGSIMRILDEDMVLSESSAIAGVITSILTETVLLAEALHAEGTFDTVYGTVDEGITASESPAIAAAVMLAFAEGVLASESAHLALMLSLAERMLASDDAALRLPLSLAVSEGMRSAESVLTSVANLVAFGETVGIDGSVLIDLMIFLSIAEETLLSDAVVASVALVMSVAEGMLAADTVERNDFVTVISALSRISLNKTDSRIYID